nr:PREDICTED: uncharacterized protein LOC108202276 [Daucus carota subsp. sativus]
MPNDTWNSAYVCDAMKSTTDVVGREKSSFGSTVIEKPKGFRNNIITNNKFDSRPSNFQLNTNSQRYAASPNISKSHVHTQRLKSSNQLSSGYRSAGQFQPHGKFSSYTAHNQRSYCARDAGLNDRLNARMWNGSDGFNEKEKSNINGEIEATTELTRGPRGQGNKDVSTLVEDKRIGVRRDQYNLEDFQTNYDNAKFYVIKSYSEDDIHKCIKYNVWSSTPNGNRKLNAAFHDTQAKTSDSGMECPIFLFYSVNGSGQFVGLAEMTGQMDFAKNMNFWQRDKWNGFFPVKWHIVKDIPNTQLRHIVIESNDNKPVTHSRDTQEIGLQQGLKMLKIFKSYSGVTSMLDDFNFYENREQSLKAKRNQMRAPQTEIHTHHEYPKHQRARERTNRGRFTHNSFPDAASSIIRQTRKLSINH